MGVAYACNDERRTVNTDPSEESVSEPEGPHEPAPVPWRIGKLTMIFLAIVAVGFLIKFAVSDEAPVNSLDSTFDVENFPTGALGGQPAPDVSFPLFDGSTFDLGEHLINDRRPVVLNLWASWCFPCRTEMPEFSEVAMANLGVAFVGVAVTDDREAATAFAEEIGAAYPLGIDEDNEVVGSYPYIGLPTTYLISADGTVTHQIQGQITGVALQAFIDYDFGG